jgi:acetyltransferase-like isoleucine patch superfamily enzyme
MIDNLVLKIRRGETPLYRGLRSGGKRLLESNLPVPRFFYPLLRGIFDFQNMAAHVFRWSASYFYREPLFRARCAAVGKNLRLARLPFIVSHAKIYIGDNVNIFGKVDIFSGRIFDEPRLVIQNRVDIGHNVTFIVNKEIVIEDDVNIASGVRFMDTDAHPRDTGARIADLPPSPEEIKPVRVCRNAWIGHNVFVLKGVTIGEGAIIGVNSVVLSDIPPYSVAIGNPARVIVKNLERPGKSATPA